MKREREGEREEGVHNCLFMSCDCLCSVALSHGTLVSTSMWLLVKIRYSGSIKIVKAIQCKLKAMHVLHFTSGKW